MNGYTPDISPKPATKAQLIALRDHLLGLGLYSSAAAVDNAIDCIQRDADIAYKLESLDLGTHVVISGGEVEELGRQEGDGFIPL